MCRYPQRLKEGVVSPSASYRQFSWVWILRTETLKTGILQGPLNYLPSFSLTEFTLSDDFTGNRIDGSTGEYKYIVVHVQGWAIAAYPGEKALRSSMLHEAILMLKVQNNL